MSAQIIEEQQDELGNAEAVTDVTGAPQQPDPQDDLPEKYRGKSAKEIAAMHVEAERLIGRQGQDLGELRKLADTFIRANMQVPKPQPVAEAKPATAEDDDLEFFKNPKQAIQKALAEHPTLKQLQAHTATTAQERAVKTLTEKHGDFGAVIADTGFQEWVGKSKVRQALFARAHRAYDVTAADELFSTWKELQAAKAPQQAPAGAGNKQARQSTLNAAKVPSGNGGGGNEGGKKIYRRIDVLQLMQNDPARYEALAPEIQQAYAEGRVR